MTNGKTIRERIAVLETKLDTQVLWLKGIVMAILASTGINLAI